jgi:NAD(P)-dependent dehydrogenase (short-subunit alcohol dehydrogenase family)
MSSDLAAGTSAVEAAVGGQVPLLAGRTVILTGASGGIGRVTARVLGAAGARVALTDLDAGALAPVERELREAGTEVLAVAMDASDQAAFVTLHERVAAELGPVDGLVNCAGLFEIAAFETIDATAWSRTIAANLGTAAAGCLAVLPGMVQRGSGSIVNVASTAGEYGSISPASHYAAAKAGVIGLTKSLAREAGPAGVRVNALSPGPIETAALRATTPEQKAIAGSRTLFGRLGQPEEIAAGCAYLLSPLSTFVTGHVLRVNGGALL